MGGLFRHYPVPSDRMGALWTLLPIRGSSILEFGTSGTSRFTLNGFARMQGRLDSGIYATHMAESDIVMGGTKRLENAIDELACAGQEGDRQGPPVLFVMPSTLTGIIGFDLDMFVRSVQDRYPDTRLVSVPADGYQGDWTIGIQKTLALLAAALPQAVERTERLTFNIIGSIADDFNYQADYYELIRMLKEAFQAEPLCIMTADTSLDELKAMGGAHVNIVLRQEGVEAAQLLRDRFGTPYVLGRPYGVRGTIKWLEQLSLFMAVPCNAEFISREREEVGVALKRASGMLRHSGFQAKLAIGGHIDVVRGIASFAEEAGYALSHVWCNSARLADDGIPYYTESQWEEAVKGGDFSVLMASGVALRLASGPCRKVPIGAPDHEVAPVSYPYTPYVGFRGALYLLSRWLNPAQS